MEPLYNESMKIPLYRRVLYAEVKIYTTVLALDKNLHVVCVQLSDYGDRHQKLVEAAVAGKDRPSYAHSVSM